MRLDIMGAVERGNMKNPECIMCGECCCAYGKNELRRKFGSSMVGKAGEYGKHEAQV